MKIFQEKRSFVQILLPWFTDQPQKLIQFYNPLDIRPDSLVRINAIDHRGIDYTLVEVQEYERILNGKTHYFTDYVLAGTKILGEEPKRIKLRVTPNETAAGGYDYTVLLLELDDEMQHSNDIDNAIDMAEDDRVWVIDIEADGENPAEHFEYQRIEDIRIGYEADVHTIKDKNKNKDLEYNEVDTKQIDYWDFIRLVEDFGLPFHEYYFVEQSKYTGYVWMWCGREVEQSSIEVL